MDFKIKAIIIENESSSIEYLSNILTKHYKEIELLGFAKSISSSIELITQKKPELIFMDIELDDGICFEIFDVIKNPDFEVIFITGFDNYIQKAMEHYAFSFILKPFEPKKIIGIINRYIKLKERNCIRHKIDTLQNFIKTNDPILLIQVGVEHISLHLNQITKCTSEGNYTKFYLISNKQYLASNNLKYYENLLNEQGFFRPNRFSLINIKHIRSIFRRETIILKNNEKINISIRNKSKVSELISMLS